MTTSRPEDIQQTIVQFRAQLLRFARLQLRSDALAEDVVQETLLAACESADRFSGASSLKTWVFSILRNKIIDEFRSQKRAPQMVTAAHNDETLDHLMESLFDQAEHWIEAPAAWGNPEMALEQKRFWQVFEACLEGLPATPARAFMMREFLGLETDEICKELKITSSNCWVLLHRARLGLRECLGLGWFSVEGAHR
jgi:RNA polymerase sigma-70 factor (ECF subfamily)